MWDNLIGRQIRRCNRNLILVNLLILAGLAALAYFHRQYLTDCIHGPYPMTAAQLAQPDPGHTFVHITGDKLVDTGFVLTQHDQNGAVTTKAHFLILRVGGRLLLLRSAGENLKKLSYTGTLTPLTADVASDILAPLERDAPRIAPLILPHMLNQTASFRKSAYLSLLMILPLAWLSVWNLRKGKRRQADFGLSPIAQRLARYGDVDTVAHRIEQDALIGVEKFGSASLTRQWIFSSSLFGFSAMEISSLIWIYEKVTTTKYAFFLSIAKSYTAVLYDRHGCHMEIHGRKKKVEALLLTLRQRVPWALSSYKKQLTIMARKELPELAALVDQRRREMEQAQSQTAAGR